MQLPDKVKLFEVGPRDGLQSQSRILTTEQRVQLILALKDAGLRSIEIGSFIPESVLPQVAGAAAVLSALHSRQPAAMHDCYHAITPNLRGVQDAVIAGGKQIAVLMSASQAFSLKNTACSRQDALLRARKAARYAQEKGGRVRAYLSCAFGCPYGESINSETVVSLAEELISYGCYEVSLGDTTGQGHARQVKQLIRKLKQRLPVSRIAVHFHDSYGQALTNAYAALQEGVSVIDCSVAGLGGCPNAPGAGGNLATEDVLYMLDGAGIETGINMDRLITAGKMVCDMLGITTCSRTARSLGSNNR